MVKKIKKIMLLIFVVIVVLVMASAIYYVSVPINMQDLSYETVKKSISAQRAYIVRDEEIYYADTSGTIYNNVRDGERIKADALLATIYHTDVSSDTLKALRTVDNKIREHSQSKREFTDFRFDRTDTESKVAAIIEDIPKAAARNDVARVAQCKQAINDLRAGLELSDEDVLKTLYEQKNEIEEKISSSKSEIFTNKAGIFTTYTDGLENFLIDDDIDTYTVSYIKSLPDTVNDRITSQSVGAGSPVCKIVNNHVWYLLMAVPTEEIEQYKKGTQVTVVLDAIGENNINGEIYNISEEENGESLCVIKCSTYKEGAFSYRVSKAELIFESHSGYRVPIHALRTDKEGNKYVKCSKGANEYNCYCVVEYTNAEEEYVIIRSQEQARNKLDDMERIIVGER